MFQFCQILVLFFFDFLQTENKRYIVLMSIIFVLPCVHELCSEKTRAPRGTDRSPEYNEHFCYKLYSRVKNLTTEWNEKQQHFITHASRSLLWINVVAVAFRSEDIFWRRGTPPPPVTYFASPLTSPWADMAKHVSGHEHFIPTKFRKHPLSGSVVKADYVFPYIYKD